MTEMMPEILVLPRQNDDRFKNEVSRKLIEKFQIPHHISPTIVFYKPQGRPLDGIDGNLSPVLRSRERKPYEDAGRKLLIFVHDTYIPQDILSSLEQEWDCKVFQWRNEADWITICQYLETFMKKKSYIELMYDCVQSYVPVMKLAICLLCPGFIIAYVFYRLYMKIKEY